MKDILYSSKLQKIKKEKRKNLGKRLIYVLVISTVCFFSLVLFLRWDKVALKEVEISGNEVLEETKIREIIDRELNGKYLFLIPKKNLFFYPEKKITENLLEKFKRIKNISVSLYNTSTLKIDLKEREEKYVWCGNTLPESLYKDASSCYFMDESGYVFDEAPYFLGNLYLRFYGGNFIEEGENPVGKNYPDENFLKLIFLSNEFSYLNIKVSAFFEDTNKEVSAVLSNYSKERKGTKILFLMSDKARSIAENLRSVMFSKAFESEYRDKKNDLLYIDLRYGNKVYYKFGK